MINLNLQLSNWNESLHDFGVQKPKQRLVYVFKYSGDGEFLDGTITSSCWCISGKYNKETKELTATLVTSELSPQVRLNTNKMILSKTISLIFDEAGQSIKYTFSLRAVVKH